MQERSSDTDGSGSIFIIRWDSNVVRREAYFKSVYGEDFPMDKFNELTREKYYGICDKEGIGVKEGARELLIYAKEHGYKVGLATSSREIHAKASLEKSVCGNILMAGFLAIR